MTRSNLEFALTEAPDILIMFGHGAEDYVLFED
jgi:hypothetical protein